MRLPLLTAIVALVVGVAPARAETLVTLGFDDETPGQLAPAAMLDALGLHGTFYVNTGRIGQAGRMSWAQVHDLAARGHEIGGHGVVHRDSLLLDGDALRANICDDRETLLREGFPATSFAYPNGHYSPAVQQVVRDCGYTSARTVGGIAPSAVCVGAAPCPVAELLPAPDPFATRTAPPANHRTGVAGLEAAVLQAESTGGWLQLVFHRFDEQVPSAVTSATFATFSRWLADREVLGTRVVTAAEAAAAPLPASPHAAPVHVSASRRARVRPRDALPHVPCPAACVVQVTITPTASAARALGVRAGVPVATGSSVRDASGVAAVTLVPRTSVGAAWRRVQARLLLRITSVVTTRGPAAVATDAESAGYPRVR